MQGTPRKSWISYLACYLVWACLGALGLYAALVWRTTILSLAVGRDRWTATLMDQLGSIVLMLLWVVFVIWLEAFLRRGLVLGKLGQRAIKVFGAEIVFLLVAMLV